VIVFYGVLKRASFAQSGIQRVKVTLKHPHHNSHTSPIMLPAVRAHRVAALADAETVEAVAAATERDDPVKQILKANSARIRRLWGRRDQHRLRDGRGTQTIVESLNQTGKWCAVGMHNAVAKVHRDHHTFRKAASFEVDVKDRKTHCAGVMAVHASALNSLFKRSIHNIIDRTKHV
jgi:hypothetical protein